MALAHPETLKGERDRVILGLLLGCGLQRDELVRLTVDEIQQREDVRVIVATGEGKTTPHHSSAELDRALIKRFAVLAVFARKLLLCE